MFLRRHSRKKNGKPHHYWSIVESRRSGRRVQQRQVLYLGEISSSQEAAWRKTVEVFDETAGESRQLALFASERPLSAQQVDAIGVKLSALKLVRPRSFGDCWLGCVLWEELGLDSFWGEKLGEARGEVAWEKVVAVLAVNRLCAPGSEFAVHRRWFLSSAMDELLGVGFDAAGKDRLYRCLDRLLPHKEALCRHLSERWKTLFDASFDVLLYDLTSTYFEGLCEQIPKAKHGYSRDGRPDCRQVVIALVVTVEGLPLAYEVLAGNTADHTTLRQFLDKIERLYGRARRVWVMDRGIPTEARLAEMRSEGVAYLVGTPRAMLRKLEKDLVDLSWEQVHEGMKVRLLKREEELYVQASSADRRQKETAMRRRRLKGLVHGLNRLKRRRHLSRDDLLRKVAVLRKEAGRAASFVKVREPSAGEAVDRTTFICRFDRAAWKAAQERDGCYILRGYVPWEDFPREMDKSAAVLWQWYMQLVQIEASFRTLKSELGLRPMYHWTEKRVEAHILVAFLGYCLSATLRLKLQRSAPGLTPREALAELSSIKMLEVQVPTTDGRTLVLPRHTEPEPAQRMILQKLGLTLPPQPPPRIHASALPAPASEHG